MSAVPTVRKRTRPFNLEPRASVFDTPSTTVEEVVVSPSEAPQGVETAAPATLPTAAETARFGLAASAQRVVLPNMPIIDRNVADLQLGNNETRKRTSKLVDQLAASIKQFGIVIPLITNDAGKVFVGHGRLAAARQLGLLTVPTLNAKHLSEQELRAYALADNKLAALSDWSKDGLMLEFAALADPALNFDLELTGYSSFEIESYSGKEVAGAAKGQEDESPEPGQHAVTRVGDLWVLGAHRIICGDAKKAAVFTALMAGVKARMVFADPPFNVHVPGHVSGLGKRHHGEFVEASGEMSSAEFQTFLTTSFLRMAEVSVDGALHYLCMDWRHLKELIAAGEQVYSEFKQLCVWVKTNAGMGTFYRSQHEMVAVFKVGKAPHVNTFGLGEGGRYRTNCWSYAGANAFGKDRDAELAMHPTVKPVLMVMDAIKDCSYKGDIVLDGFGGSGTTLIAAEKTQRLARLVELDPLYVDVTVRRWEELTGKKAILEGDGRCFADIAAIRAAEGQING